MKFRRRTVYQALFVVVWPCIALAAPASTLNVDDVIAKYIDALGGRSKLDGVKSIKLTAKVSFPGGIEAAGTAEVMRPNKVRTDVTMQGRTDTEAYDGISGWALRGTAGRTEPEKLPKEDLAEIEARLRIESPLIDYRKKGFTAALAGTEDIEGAKAYKIKLSKADGSTELHYLDAEKFLPLKIRCKWPFQGGHREYEQSFSDYRAIDGLILAHWIQGRDGGGNIDFTASIEKVQINASIAEERFAMPKAQN